MKSTTADSIKEVANGRFAISHMIGKGAFGRIYEAYDSVQKMKVAVKETKPTKTSQLLSESRIYKLLIGGGIPKMHYFGNEDGYNVLVMDLLGPSLEEIRSKRVDQRLTLPTVLNIGVKAVERIEFMHSKSIIHRDIKPDNFLIGIGKKINEIYLVDFGLARRYRDQKTKIHIPYRENKSLVGTARYASINTHLGIEQSRRDDLECLAYVLLYLIRGSVPWQGLKGILPKEKHSAIMEKKMECSAEMLAKGHCNALAQFLNHCKNLKFDEKPDYKYIIGILSKPLLDISKDVVTFDWEFKKSSTIALNYDEEIADEFEEGAKIEVPYANFIGNERHFYKNKRKQYMYNIICSGIDMEKLSKLILNHADVVDHKIELLKFQTVGNKSDSSPKH